MVAHAALRPSPAQAQTNGFVDLTSDQTIGGVKTFSVAPIVPAAAFPQAAVDGLVQDLAAKQPLIAPGTFIDTTTDQAKAGVLTLLAAPVLPHGFTFTPEPIVGEGAGGPSLAISAPMGSGNHTELLFRNFNFLGTPDPGVFLGHNIWGSPNHNSGQPGVFFGIEEDYNDGVTRKSEFYWEYVPPAGGFKRLVYGTVDRTTHVRDSLALAAESIVLADDSNRGLLAVNPRYVSMSPPLLLTGTPVLTLGNSTVTSDSTINLDGNADTAASVILFLRGGTRIWNLIRVRGSSEYLGVWDYANSKYHLLMRRGAGPGGGLTTLSSAVAVRGDVGFYGRAPVAQPTVTGSHEGNPALASLLSALAGLGLISNSSTA